MCTRAKVFKYEIIKTMPLSSLEVYKEHRRLKVFYNKGVVCVNCGLEATQLAVGKEKNGNLHVDVYTDDFYPLTVDHIIPKSKGGSDELVNLDPMCARCNFAKGDKLDWNGATTKRGIKQPQQDSKWIVGKGDFFEIRETDVGKEVFIKKGGTKRKFRELGTISKFVNNPHTGEVNFMIEGNEKSMYFIKRGFLRI